LLSNPPTFPTVTFFTQPSLFSFIFGNQLLSFGTFSEEKESAVLFFGTHTKNNDADGIWNGSETIWNDADGFRNDADGVRNGSEIIRNDADGVRNDADRKNNVTESKNNVTES